MVTVVRDVAASVITHACAAVQLPHGAPVQIHADIVGNEVEAQQVAAEEEAEEVYSYNPNNKRDPFQSFLATTSEDELLDNIPRTPLQKYEVGQYTLTGIIWAIDRPRAMVEDPDGIGHVVEVGTYMGTKWGKVESIEDGLVVITEELQTVDGQLVVKRQELRLESGASL